MDARRCPLQGWRRWQETHSRCRAAPLDGGHAAAAARGAERAVAVRPSAVPSDCWTSGGDSGTVAEGRTARLPLPLDQRGTVTMRRAWRRDGGADSERSGSAADDQCSGDVDHSAHKRWSVHMQPKRRDCPDCLIAALLPAAAAALHRPAEPAAESVKGNGCGSGCGSALAKSARRFFSNRNSRIF